MFHQVRHPDLEPLETQEEVEDNKTSTIRSVHPPFQMECWSLFQWNTCISTWNTCISLKMHAFYLNFYFEMHKTADFHFNLLVSWELVPEDYQGRPMKCAHFNEISIKFVIERSLPISLVNCDHCTPNCHICMQICTDGMSVWASHIHERRCCQCPMVNERLIHPWVRVLPIFHRQLERSLQRLKSDVALFTQL